MPLTITCPVSGAAFRLTTFGAPSSGTTVVSTPHPLLCCTAQQLIKVQEEQFTNAEYLPRIEDCHIMLCAWLEQVAQVGIAHWVGRLNPIHFSSRWHESQLDNLAQLAAWLVHNCKHPALEIVPHLRLTPELNGENIQSWMDSCKTIINSFDTVFQVSERLQVRAQLEAAERLLNDYAIDDSKLTAAARKLRSRKAYLHNSLALHDNQQAVELVTKVCLAPHLYEVRTIQRTKEFCLDYLNESGVENYNDKQELIQVLDAAMVEKLGMAAILGCAMDGEDKNLLGAITAKYSIEINGQTFLNGATPKVSQAIQRNAQQGIITEIETRTYTSEPTRDQFKSQLGFNIAHKQWAEQVRTGTSSKQIIEAL